MPAGTPAKAHRPGPKDTVMDNDDSWDSNRSNRNETAAAHPVGRSPQVQHVASVDPPVSTSTTLPVVPTRGDEMDHLLAMINDDPRPTSKSAQPQRALGISDPSHIPATALPKPIVPESKATLFINSDSPVDVPSGFCSSAPRAAPDDSADAFSSLGSSRGRRRQGPSLDTIFSDLGGGQSTSATAKTTSTPLLPREAVSRRAEPTLDFLSVPRPTTGNGRRQPEATETALVPELKVDTSTLAAQLTSSQQQLRKALHDNDDLTQHVTRLRAELGHAQADRDDRSSVAADLELQLDATRAQVLELQQQLQSARASSKDTTADLEAAAQQQLAVLAKQHRVTEEQVRYRACTKAHAVYPYLPVSTACC